MQKGNINIKKEKFEVICEDNVCLKGVLLIPDNPRAVIQFNNGTATKKEVYLKFLTYLAEQGYICCLWDYRGSGDSVPADMRNCNYTFSDYGVKDMPAIKKFLNLKFPNLPYIIVAHSAGGQQIGFMPNLDDVKAVINFAVSAGYYPNMPLIYRLKAYFFFYLFSPISVLFTGYVNAKRFGLMEDLPKKVVYEWRDWCSRSDYLFDKRFYNKTIPEGNFKKFQFPIHTFWTIDDTISSEKNTKNFWRHIQSKDEISFTKLDPKEYKLKAIGHFGFFKSHMKELLWGKVVEKIERYVEK